jgi:hypothetical protein
MIDICGRSGAQVVHTDHGVAFAQQPLAQVRAQKARPAGNEYPWFAIGIILAIQNACTQFSFHCS